MELIYFLNISKIVTEIVTLLSWQLGLYKIVFSFYLEQTVLEISVLLLKNYPSTSTNFIKLKKIYFNLILRGAGPIFSNNSDGLTKIYPENNYLETS
jgi:hypothetical protein